MKIDIVVAPELAHQIQFANHFKDGLDNFEGVEARIVREGAVIEGDVVVCWGWRLGAQFAGKPTLIAERGYLGDRMHWTSLGWNGLNGRARVPHRQDRARYLRLFPKLIQPWKGLRDGYPLIIGQVAGDASLFGLDLATWYERQARRFEGACFRPHPLSIERNEVKPVLGARLLRGTLAEALDGAAFVVTWNSNAGVESVLYGIPTIAQDVGSMAYDVASHTTPVDAEPDREAWVANLSWRQWSATEVQSGDAWRHVSKALTDGL